MDHNVAFSKYNVFDLWNAKTSNKFLKKASKSKIASSILRSRIEGYTCLLIFKKISSLPVFSPAQMIFFSTLPAVIRAYPFSIFARFHVPRVMKIGENCKVWFLQGFMYPGSWKSEKIETSDFCKVSCTGGSWKLEKIEKVRKSDKKWQNL